MEETQREGRRTLEWLAGGGAMGELIASKDWSGTPLGPIDSWPQSLRTTVSLCLSSNFPINILWGPDAIQIYNDGYRVICGEAHPCALGESYSVTWESAWPAIGEPFANARKGQASYLENQRMFISRNGYLEESYFTFSLSPIRDESGGIVGLLNPATETTASMLVQRRNTLLRTIAQTAGKAQSKAEAVDLSLKALAESTHDVPCVAFYAFDPSGASVRFQGSIGFGEGADALPQQVVLEQRRGLAIPLRDVVASGAKVVVRDVARTLGSFPCQPYSEPVTRAVIVPVGGAGSPIPLGALVLGVSSRLPYDDAYATFHDMLGDAIGASLGNARAYEEERARAEALAEIDRAKTAFFSNISHEFRTPLTLILGPVEDALEAEERALRGENLEAVYRNSMRLLKLVNALLDFSRIEAGRAQAHFESTDLGAFTRDLASHFRSAAERAGLRFTVDTDRFDVPVRVDREMWEKVVLNLLSNALKFTFEGGIAITLRRVGEHAELAVRDTGTGVRADELPRLFERFHRIQGARSRSHEGSGIGLALVAELVKLHEGDIEVDSAVGEGTTFRVRIPLANAGRESASRPASVGTSERQGAAPPAFGSHQPYDAPEAEEAVKAADASSRSRRTSAFVEEVEAWVGMGAGEPGECEERVTEAGAGGYPLREHVRQPYPMPGTDTGHSRPTILVADDNPDMREYVANLLGAHWKVKTVSDGAAALVEARRDVPDLIVSDVMMPRMTGFELLNGLRNDEATRGVPVILLSARAGDDEAVQGLHAGADDYLVKPFSAKELLARVATHLNLARLRRDIEIEHKALLARDEFLSVASHELQTPVTSVRIYIDRLLRNARSGSDEPLASPPIRKALENAYLQIERLVSLINVLLDVTRARAGKLDLEPREVEVVPFLEGVVGAFAGARPDRRVGFKRSVGNGITAHWDPLRIEQVLGNLLSNAVKYGNAKPIEVEVSGEGERVRVSVRDQGVGIAKKEQDSLFRRFEQSPGARRVGGLGLGLYISQQIAQVHGGQISVSSQEGKGSTFTLDLPIRAGREAAAKRAADATGAHA